MGWAARCSSQTSCRVTPWRRNSRWIAAQAGCGRCSLAVLAGPDRADSPTRRRQLIRHRPAMPASRARRMHSPAAVGLIPGLAATCVWTGQAVIRSTSRTHAWIISAPPCPAPLGKRSEALPIRRSPNGARHRRPQLVAIPGTGGRDPSESLVAINRNTWSLWPGARTVHRQGRIPGRGQTDPGGQFEKVVEVIRQVTTRFSARHILAK